MIIPQAKTKCEFLVEDSKTPAKYNQKFAL